jgi:hypothetical protein
MSKKPKLIAQSSELLLKFHVAFFEKNYTIFLTMKSSMPHITRQSYPAVLTGLSLVLLLAC